MRPENEDDHDDNTLEKDSRTTRSRANCFGVFSLQTGVTMIIWFDFFFFTLLCCQFGLGFEETQSMAQDNDGDVIILQQGPLHLNLFNLMTDGVCIALSGIKLYFGLQYLLNVSYPPKIAYEYLDDGLGKFQWHTKRVKVMRHIFKNYFLASMVAYIFIGMQTIVLLMIFWDSTIIYFRYACLLLVCMFQFLALWKLGQHLQELDQQVNYRITKYRYVQSSELQQQKYKSPDLLVNRLNSIKEDSQQE